jgi:hypothetical protein
MFMESNPVLPAGATNATDYKDTGHQQTEVAEKLKPADNQN